MRLTYPVVLYPGPSGGYGVVFPDLDGCVTVGDSQAEALMMAEEALALHLKGMLADGDPVPPADFNRDLGEFDGGPVPGQIVGVVTVEVGATEHGIAA